MTDQEKLVALTVERDNLKRELKVMKMEADAWRERANSLARELERTQAELASYQ